MIIVTEHAKAQMRERGITEDEVTAVLRRPAQTIATRTKRAASYALVLGKYIVVIHEKGDGEDIVITAMKVDYRRLVRFGFSHIR